jgi:hypothetical protein
LKREEMTGPRKKSQRWATPFHVTQVAGLLSLSAGRKRKVKYATPFNHLPFEVGDNISSGQRF